MSSDRVTGPTDNLLRLLTQYQQNSSNSVQIQTSVNEALPVQAALAPMQVPIIQVLGSLLARYQQQSKGGFSGANYTAPSSSTWSASGDASQSLSVFQAHVQSQHQLGAPRPSSTANGATLGQQILASAQLLSASNPGLAAAAIAQAFRLNPQQSVKQQQQPQPSQQQQPQNQPNQFKNSLDSIHQQLQSQTINSSSPAAAIGVGSLGFLPNDAPIVPASSVDGSDLRQMNVAHSHLSEKDTRNVIKNASNSPLSLHYLTQGMQSHPPLNLSAQNWTLEQLESHAKHLQDSHQPIPQSIAILLANARRKEEKEKAKKLANRKSAFSSRIRKKAKIDAMAEENIKLKREATILSFLPDPVVAIGIGGEITFCSRQMERVLQHRAIDLIGENIENLLAPDSSGELRKMIKDVVTVNEQAALEEQQCITRLSNAKKNYGFDEGRNGVSTTSNPSACPMPSSKQSFPMFEVEVDSYENVSDSSGYFLKKKSSKESNHTYPETDKDAVFGVPSSKELHQDRQLQSCHNRKRVLNTSRSSSSLAETQESKSSTSTDSSLSKTKERPGAINSSEDSGYRGSNDIQESYKSSSSSVNNADEDGVNTLKGVARIPPLAPACNVRLIRRDLSTLWCELTSSIHSVNFHGDGDLATSSRNGEILNEQHKSNLGSSILKKRVADLAKPDEGKKEILICFRPIREGPKVGEELRFRKTVVTDTPKESEHPSAYRSEFSSSCS